MIRAEVLADSLNHFTQVRLTTLRITYPRMVHSELMTHRAFARNASSSRAIPAKRLRAQTMWSTSEPASWNLNQPGMQGGAHLSPFKTTVARFIWRAGAFAAVLTSKTLDALGLHKQISNRPIEPFSDITVVLTGTADAFNNFFALRDHHMADPTIQNLAQEMKRVMRNSTPRTLLFGEWHLPLVDELELAELKSHEDPLVAAKASAARCARTSYLNHDGSAPNLKKDLALFNRLCSESPVHASPTEHQAICGLEGNGCFGPTSGWGQFRKMIANEVITEAWS